MDDNPNEYRLPKRVNDPILLWFYPLQQVLPLFFSIGAIAIMGHTLLFLSFGFAWFFLFDYIEARFPRGFLLHQVYWAGLTKGFVKETKTVPDAMKREFFQ